MKVSLHWLNSYLDHPADADAAAACLESQGFPVESREPLPGGDVRLEVEVTSNRVDCLCHVGVAREVAAGTGRSLRLPRPAAEASAAGPVGVAVLSEACPLYTARVIRGVKVGPSPDWLRERLEAIGLRSVNNVVDVTNFVLHETGQPLHAFDLARLRGGRIVVRGAQPGETITAIDGSSHKLAGDMLVIADGSGPVAVAGVMGGRESEVTAATTDVLLEAAVFDPLTVRRTSRSLKLMSDSSYRFERGVDPCGVAWASRRAAGLIVDVAGGHIEGGATAVGEAGPATRRVVLRASRCAALLGFEIDQARQVGYLERLGFSPRVEGGDLVCDVPSYRLDVAREVDLIEEVARMHGLDRVPTQRRISVEARPRNTRVAAMEALRAALVAHGYFETITDSLVSVGMAKAFAQGGDAVRLADERRKAAPMLRTSLLPSLLQVRKLNQDAGNMGVKLFEVASVWSVREGRVHEETRLGMVRDAEESGVALRELRGTVEELLTALGGTAATLGVRAMADQARAELVVGDRGDRGERGEGGCGWMGLLTAAEQKSFDLQVPVAVAELDLSALLAMYPPRVQVGMLPRFPLVERDLSVVVAESVTWASLTAALHGARPRWLERVSLVTVYRGKPMEKGRKSVSLRLCFRDPLATLTHEQVDGEVGRIVTELKHHVGAELRA